MTRWVIENANARVLPRQGIAHTPERLVYVARWRERHALGLMQLSVEFLRDCSQTTERSVR